MVPWSEVRVGISSVPEKVNFIREGPSGPRCEWRCEWRAVHARRGGKSKADSDARLRNAVTLLKVRYLTSLFTAYE